MKGHDEICNSTGCRGEEIISRIHQASMFGNTLWLLLDCYCAKWISSTCLRGPSSPPQIFLRASISVRRDALSDTLPGSRQSIAPRNALLMTPIPLRFDSRDMLNSALVGPDGMVEFTTNTPPDDYAHKRTIILGRSGARAAINWAAKSFVLEGLERPWSQLKKTVGGPLSSCVFLLPSVRDSDQLKWEHTVCRKWRIWNWSETRYTVRYAKDPDGETRYAVRRTREDGSWEVRAVSVHVSLYLIFVPE